MKGKNLRVSDKFSILLSASVLIWSIYDVTYNDNFGKKNTERFDSTETVFLAQDANTKITIRTKEKLLADQKWPTLRKNIALVRRSDRKEGIYTGSAFKVGNDLWITARHVVEGCKSSYLQGSLYNQNYYTNLIEKVFFHPVSDLAMFRFANRARHFSLPSIYTKERKNSLYTTTAFGAGYPDGMPGQIYVKYLGDRILNNRNHDTYEPILDWAVSLKTPKSLKTLSGISGGPLFNSESKVIGVTIVGNTRRGTISTSDRHSINFLLGAFKSAGYSKREISDQISVDNFNNISNKYRRQSSIMQVICKA